MLLFIFPNHLPLALKLLLAARIACTLVELFKVFHLDGNIQIGWFFSGAACFVHDEYYFCLSEQSPQRTALSTALENREVPAGWLKKR